MKKEVFDIKELRYLGILFLLAIIAFRIAFFKENIVVLLRNVASLFWLFALPGYFIMLYWKDKIGFLERFFAGMLMSAAITGILSYYIGIAGLNLKYHFILIPSLLILIGFLLNLRKNNNLG